MILAPLRFSRPDGANDTSLDPVRSTSKFALRSSMGQGQDYFTIKVCSVGKSDRRRDVTQGNPLRPSEWGFKIGYFPNIYGDSVHLAAFQ